MKLINSLRFRLSFIFGIFLTILAISVLIFLLQNIEKQLIDNIDAEIKTELEGLRSFTINELLDDEESESFLKLFENEVFENLIHSPLQEEAYFLISNERENIFHKTLSEKMALIKPLELLNDLPENEIASTKISDPNIPIRIMMTTLENDYKFIIAVSLQEHEVNIAEMKFYFITAACLIIFLGCSLAWVTIGKSMKGVIQVSLAAEDFAAGDLKRRVNWHDKGSEIENLVSHFNHMTGQIEKLIYGMKDVTNNIAHDLRTPVARMRAAAERALISDPDNELAAIIVQESERQAVIIEDILSLAESEGGALKLNLSPVNLNQLLSELVDIFQPSSEDKNNALIFSSSEKEVVANLDTKLFKRVIANLLDNAMKYCSDGTISVTLETIKDTILIRVKDNGPGIAENEKDKIFDRFYRGDKSRNSQGSGLGLSLAKAYIENHKGSLELEHISQGTSFLITLPKN